MDMVYNQSQGRIYAKSPLGVPTSISETDIGEGMGKRAIGNIREH